MIKDSGGCEFRMQALGPRASGVGSLKLTVSWFPDFTELRTVWYSGIHPGAWAFEELGVPCPHNASRPVLCTAQVLHLRAAICISGTEVVDPLRHCVLHDFPGEARRVGQVCVSCSRKLEPDRTPHDVAKARQRHLIVKSEHGFHLLSLRATVCFWVLVL